MDGAFMHLRQALAHESFGPEWRQKREEPSLLLFAQAATNRPRCGRGGAGRAVVFVKASVLNKGIVPSSFPRERRNLPPPNFFALILDNDVASSGKYDGYRATKRQ